jgi:hypothetical protein
MSTESTKGPFGNGRDAKGKFTKGNPGGPGNPLAGRVARLRFALVNAVTAEDIEQVISALLQQAKDGDVGATKELLSRVLGRPLEADLLARIEALESSTLQERRA